VLDVSKYNLPQWIMRTYFKYEAKRYGGYEMLMRAPEDLTLTEFISLLDSFTNIREYTPPIKEPYKPFYKVICVQSDIAFPIEQSSGSSNLYFTLNTDTKLFPLILNRFGSKIVAGSRLLLT
jgi:hypothetical protein